MSLLDILLGRSGGDWFSRAKWKRELSPAALAAFDALASRYQLQPAESEGVFRDRFDEFQVAISHAWSRMRAPKLLGSYSAPTAFELRLGPGGEHYRMEFWVPPPGRQPTGIPSIDDPAWRSSFQGEDWEGVRAGRFVLTPDVLGADEVADALPELCALVRRFSEPVVEVEYWHPGMTVTMLPDAVSVRSFANDLDIARAFCDRARRIDFAAHDD